MFASGNDFLNQFKDRLGGMTQTGPDIEVLWEATKDAENYVEIGTMYGVSSFAVWMNNTRCNVITFDPKDYPERQELHKNTQINFIQERSPECAKGRILQIDTLMLDGCHDYADVLADLMAWYPFVNRGGNVLFHDYTHSSPGVRQVCDTLIEGHMMWIVRQKPTDIMSHPTSYFWAIKQ